MTGAGAGPDAPVLDHLVVDVRDGMDAAAARWTALGFTLTPRGHHTLGSMNHLMMFETDYLELLGFGASPGGRPELEPFPVGLNGLVFKTDDAEALHAALSARGVPIMPARAFSRPVALADGTHDAKFRTARLPPDPASHGRIYFCEHQTPELVWRPEWQRHANGAVAITRVSVAARDPAAWAAPLAAMFGDVVRPGAEGALMLPMGVATLEIAPAGVLAARHGDALAAASGREDYMAVIALRTASLARTAEALRAAGITPHTADGSLTVPASAAGNVTLVFAE
jgi:hypothetical protein